jgi:thiol-disulfide isomerase/thioredoxin
MKKVLKDKEVKKELDKLDFRMYDVDRDKDMARRYSIKSIPTIITIKDKKMRRYVGQLSKQKLLTILTELNKED